MNFSAKFREWGAFCEANDLAGKVTTKPKTSKSSAWPKPSGQDELIPYHTPKSFLDSPAFNLYYLFTTVFGTADLIFPRCK